MNASEVSPLQDLSGDFDNHATTVRARTNMALISGFIFVKAGLASSQYNAVPAAYACLLLIVLRLQ